MHIQHGGEGSEFKILDHARPALDVRDGVLVHLDPVIDRQRGAKLALRHLDPRAGQPNAFSAYVFPVFHSSPAVA